MTWRIEKNQLDFHCEERKGYVEVVLTYDEGDVVHDGHVYDDQPLLTRGERSHDHLDVQQY
jgi:hypothetical protein